MKKFITLAVALVAIASQAASIDWKVSSTRSTYLYDDNGNKFTGSAYLVLQSAVAGLLDGSFADLVSEISSTALDSVAMSSGTYKVDPQRTATNNAIVRDVSDTYQLLFLDVANEKYALSGTASNKGYVVGDGDVRLITFTPSMIGAAATAGGTTWNALSSGGDEPGPGGDDPVTPPIPEPATGALALAGVALLFRRKRA